MCYLRVFPALVLPVIYLLQTTPYDNKGLKAFSSFRKNYFLEKSVCQEVKWAIFLDCIVELFVQKCFENSSRLCRHGNFGCYWIQATCSGGCRLC